jgi:hypothetical protein
LTKCLRMYYFRILFWGVIMLLTDEAYKMLWEIILSRNNFATRNIQSLIWWCHDWICWLIIIMSMNARHYFDICSNNNIPDHTKLIVLVVWKPIYYHYFYFPWKNWNLKKVMDEVKGKKSLTFLEIFPVLSWPDFKKISVEPL